MTLTKHKIFFLFILSFIASINIANSVNPVKREFRGAWIHTVDQEKYSKMNEKEMKAYFISLLDKLKKAGINTILFQVRPEADAWYKSPYEPWSRYITGTQGKDPGWDPLAFLIEESHNRNIDFHAWLNPYRVRNQKTKQLANDHFYYKNKWWFVDYGNYIWFDPGIPASRKHIQNVIKDIVKHYDIDAVHMDDYFYPYPDGKLVFNDKKSFDEYGRKMGYTDKNKADWRRENVNTLIREIYKVIHETKPWVQFGVSPFGIYRNQKEHPMGSNTNGLTNYDGLYADVILWMKNGWVDYVIPQLYWEIGHRSADYETLIIWWAKNGYNVPIYIGQDILRTMRPDTLKRGQLYKKMLLAAKEKAVSGHCFWPAYELERNAGGIVDSLRNNYFSKYSINPANNKFDSIPPAPVKKLIYKIATNGQKTLSWTAPEGTSEMDKATRYVIYGFEKNAEVNLENAANIIALSRETNFAIPLKTNLEMFVVTALDRCHNESEGTRIAVK